MPRYVAFLRGVSPLNAKMPELTKAFEGAGFADVRTVLGSGNVVFDAARGTPQSLARRCEAAMQERLGRSFQTHVRSAAALRRWIDADPFAALGVPAGAKRIVTFLREPPAAAPALPIERDGACIARLETGAAFGWYRPGPQGPTFMALLERSFGRDITTRTWDTLRKCVVAADRR